MTIQITAGRSMTDPTDSVPIYVWGVPENRGVVRLAAIGWRARLAVWFLRRYVNMCVGL